MTFKDVYGNFVMQFLAYLEEKYCYIPDQSSKKLNWKTPIRSSNFRDLRRGSIIKCETSKSHMGTVWRAATTARRIR